MTTRKDKVEGAPFVVKTYQLVSDPDSNHLVSWSETKDSFVVWKPVEFSAEILPKYFKHSNFCSFIRQLNTYSFHKVENKQWEFKHEFFKQGQEEDLKMIPRRKSKKREVDEEEQHLEPVPAPGSVPNTPLAPLSVNLSMPHTPITPSSSLTPPIATPTSLLSDLSSGLNTSDLQEGGSEIEVEKLRQLNSQLLSEIGKLHQQQEQTQLTIRKILDELIESRREQRNLQKKVIDLSQELNLKNGSSPTKIPGMTEPKVELGAYLDLNALTGTLPNLDMNGQQTQQPQKLEQGFDFNQLDLTENDMRKFELLLNSAPQEFLLPVDDVQYSFQ